MQEEMVRLRQQAGYSREQMARHVGVSVRTLAAWEREELVSQTKIEDSLRRVKEGLERAKHIRPELARYRATELVMELLARAHQMDEVLGPDHELERITNMMPKLRKARESGEGE